MGAHILNADLKLKNVPWNLKQLYARRALEHAKSEHLQGGTNRALSPFWNKLKLTPQVPPITTKRRELFKKSINVPRVTQPTLSQLGLGGGGGSSRAASCSDDNTSSEEEEDE